MSQSKTVAKSENTQTKTASTEILNGINKLQVSTTDYFQKLLEAITNLETKITATQAAQKLNARTRTTKPKETSSSTSNEQLKFPNNKMFWFKREWKTNKDTLKGLFSEAQLKELADTLNDSGKSGDALLNAESSHLWKYVMKNEELEAKIAKKFSEAKERYDEINGITPKEKKAPAKKTKAAAKKTKAEPKKTKAEPKKNGKAKAKKDEDESEDAEDAEEDESEVETVDVATDQEDEPDDDE